MIRLFIALTILLPLVNIKIYSQRNCGTMNVLENQISKDSNLKRRMDSLEYATENRLRTSNSAAISGLIVIPVVVHILYNKSAENISDEQILSQIRILNEDFRRTNPDKNNTPSIFTGVAADVQIEFKLATKDPTGNPTTGIVRKYTSETSFSADDGMKFNSSGGSSAWNPSKYLNIWVCNLGSYLGYATFPGSSAGDADDGIVITYKAFGDIGPNLLTKYNLGRTATHEVGHYLNLRHIWGDGGCGVDDGVSDTPLAGSENYTALPCTFPGPNTCNSGAGDQPDMFQNYMDYSDDACMNLFTNGQKNRMRLLFEPGGLRDDLRDTSSSDLELAGTESGTKTYSSLGSISSQSSILSGANITYQAESEVILIPPFSVAAGASFLAVIGSGLPLLVNPLSDIKRHNEEIPPNPTPPPFKVYPNPISRNGEFFIEYPMDVAGDFSFEIYSLNGSLVQPKFIEKIEYSGTYKKAIQPQNLFPGVYILRGFAGNQPFVQKIIIQP